MTFGLIATEGSAGTAGVGEERPPRAGRFGRSPVRSRTGWCNASIAAALLIGATTGSGYAETYSCDLVWYGSLTDNGRADGPNEILAEVTNKLVIDTDTGDVFHPYFGTKSFDDRVILSEGSNGFGFKAIGVTPDLERGGDGIGRPLTYIEIRTWADGPQKPFLIWDGFVIGTGTCQ